MHKIQAKEFTRDDFSIDRLSEDALAVLDSLLVYLEGERVKFNETKEKQHWHNMIQLLPSSFNQMRTVSMNYEVLINIYYARRTHKLAEWHTLCEIIEKMPYADKLILVKARVVVVIQVHTSRVSAPFPEILAAVHSYLPRP